MDVFVQISTTVNSTVWFNFNANSWARDTGDFNSESVSGSAIAAPSTNQQLLRQKQKQKFKISQFDECIPSY